MDMTQIHRLPLGINDFPELREGNYYYVDKTAYIEAMERTSRFLFFTRPRRFGKSLFISMIKEYYDIKAQSKFDALFHDTWIAEHPTAERGSFQVLHFDFSLVGGDFSDVAERFNAYCGIELDRFIRKYASDYGKDIVDSVFAADNASDKLNIIGGAAEDIGKRLYIIVDEYDNFTNNILNTRGEPDYRAITHGTGFYRNFLKIFKAKASRALLLGVSPVTLDDLTSGANNFTNITSDPEFNMALGFSEDDVRRMIRYYQEVGKISRDVEAIVAEMKPWYDNYCFAADSLDKEPKMFNPDMVLYFLGHLIKNGRSPNSMLDPNTKTDYEKMRRLVGLDRMDGNRKGIIRDIVEEGCLYATIRESFPAEDVIKPDTFPSLLFYYGMLTIGGVAGDQLKLVIPNQNVRVQYYNYLLEQYQEVIDLNIQWLSTALRKAACDGEWQPLMNGLAEHYREDSSLRDTIGGEKNLQGYMNAYLHVSRLFIAIPEQEMNHGYCDFFLFGDWKRYPDVRHSYIIELKYLRRDATESEKESQWQAGLEQLRRYGEDARVRQLAENTTLHLVILQMRGAELVRLEEV